jgi:hypothetical protein
VLLAVASGCPVGLASQSPSLVKFSSWPATGGQRTRAIDGSWHQGRRRANGDCRPALVNRSAAGRKAPEQLPAPRPRAAARQAARARRAAQTDVTMAEGQHDVGAGARRPDAGQTVGHARTMTEPALDGRRFRCGLRQSRPLGFATAMCSTPHRASRIRAPPTSLDISYRVENGRDGRALRTRCA